MEVEQFMFSRVTTTWNKDDGDMIKIYVDPSRLTVSEKRQIIQHVNQALDSIKETDRMKNQMRKMGVSFK